MEVETKDELLEQISLAVEQVVSMRVGWGGVGRSEGKGGVQERGARGIKETSTM